MLDIFGIFLCRPDGDSKTTGAKYIGGWRDDRMHGAGTHFYANGWVRACLLGHVSRRRSVAERVSWCMDAWHS